MAHTSISALCPISRSKPLTSGVLQNTMLQEEQNKENVPFDEDFSASCPNDICFDLEWVELVESDCVEFDRAISFSDI
jgi:hypothetical protein